MGWVMCEKDTKDEVNELICSDIRIFVKAEDYERSLRKRDLSGIMSNPLTESGKADRLPDINN